MWSASFASLKAVFLLAEIQADNTSQQTETKIQAPKSSLTPRFWRHLSVLHNNCKVWLINTFPASWVLMFPCSKKANYQIDVTASCYYQPLLTLPPFAGSVFSLSVQLSLLQNKQWQQHALPPAGISPSPLNQQPLLTTASLIFILFFSWPKSQSSQMAHTHIHTHTQTTTTPLLVLNRTGLPY